MLQGPKHTRHVSWHADRGQQGLDKGVIYPPSSYGVSLFLGKELQLPKRTPISGLRSLMCTCISATAYVSKSLVINDSSQLKISFQGQHWPEAATPSSFPLFLSMKYSEWTEMQFPLLVLNLCPACPLGWFLRCGPLPLGEHVIPCVPHVK